MPIKTIQYHEFTLEFPLRHPRLSLWEKICRKKLVDNIQLKDNEPHEVRDALRYVRPKYTTSEVWKLAVVSPSVFGRKAMEIRSFKSLIHEQGFDLCSQDTAVQICLQWKEGFDLPADRSYTTLMEPIELGGQWYWESGYGNKLVMFGVDFWDGKPYLKISQRGSEGRGFAYTGIEENEWVIVECK